MVNIEGLEFPLDRGYYTKDGAHLWVQQEGDVVKVGMDAFATEMAGLLTFLSLEGEKAETDNAIGSFESAKFVSRLYSPLKGDIVAVNNDVLNNPRKINDSPYESWIFKIRPAEPRELEEHFLLTEEEITAWITEEFRRLAEQ